MSTVINKNTTLTKQIHTNLKPVQENDRANELISIDNKNRHQLVSNETSVTSSRKNQSQYHVHRNVFSRTLTRSGSNYRFPLKNISYNNLSNDKSQWEIGDDAAISGKSSKTDFFSLSLFPSEKR